MVKALNIGLTAAEFARLTGLTEYRICRNKSLFEWQPGAGKKERIVYNNKNLKAAELLGLTYKRKPKEE